MVLFRKWFEKNIYGLLLIFLMTALCIYNIIGSYGFVLFPDEFGYWVYAAKLAGYDWSDIASMGSYYSYGYSILLFPIFIICKNGIWAYRLAIGLNFLMLVAVFFILKKLASRLYVNISNDVLTIFALTASMYPPLLVYSKTTMAETTLSFMYVVICALLYKYLNERKWWVLFLLVTAYIYIYFVHMRTVGVLISGILVIAACLFFGNKKHFLAFIGIAIIFLVMGTAVKEWITDNVYATADINAVSVNDYSGQLVKVKYIFTVEGIKNLIISIAGKVLYLGTASFGLAYWGVAYSVKETLRPSCKNRYFYAFVVLSTVAEILICAIATIYPGRVDGLAYGRYHEFLVPVLMLIGMYAIWVSKKTIIWTLLIAAMQFPMLGLVIYSLIKNGQTSFQSCMVVGMCYGLGTFEFEPIKFYVYACLVGVALILAVGIIVICVRKKKNANFILTVLLLMEMALAVRAGNACMGSSDLGAFRDTRVVQKIEELCQNEDRRIVYIDNDKSARISIIQFMMRDKDIEIYKNKYNELRYDDIVLLDYEDTCLDEIRDKYSKVYIYGHFAVYYNMT